LLAASVWLLFRVPADAPWLDTLLLGAVGFFTYGPQMLLAGVAPVDMSSRRVAAAAVGFTGLMSYAGATLSSIGTGLALDRWGWEAAFDFWMLAALAAALVCIPLWRQGGVKRKAELAAPLSAPAPT
jgi:sugar phosphate permease